MSTVIFLSNCYGEDRSAGIIASALKKTSPGTNIIGAPLISMGKEYEKRGFPVITRAKIPPSGGFTTRGIAGFLDVITGFHIPIKYHFTLRKIRNKINLVVVVGDVPLLFLSWISINKPILFLAPAKSDYQNPHYKIEKWLIRRFGVKQMFTHDEYTAKNLRKSGISAVFTGNPMVDELIAESNFNPPNNSKIIGILPGSRPEAYKNFLKILKIVELLSREEKDLIFAVAIPDTIELNRLITLSKTIDWVSTKENNINTLIKNDSKVFLCHNSFVDILTHSDIIIGLAGTANEQAAYFGKPIVAFIGAGAQTSKVRMKNQENLLGGCLKVIETFPDDAVKETLFLLRNPSEITKRGEIGKFRMGPPGGAEKIAHFIQELI